VSSSSTQPVVARAAGAGGGEAPGRRAAFSAGTAWMLALPPVVTLVIMLWGITGPSYWRDEAATMSAAQRPLGNLFRTLGNIDAVHGAYYVIIWVMVRLDGTGELVTRLPSAVAMAVAAAAVAALGGRLVSPRAGLAAGLVFAVLPVVSWYGQDARPYAMAVALAAVASYLLIRALDAEPEGSRVRWLTGYAACLAALGFIDIFGLVLIVAHAVTVAIRCLHEAGVGRDGQPEAGPRRAYAGDPGGSRLSPSGWRAGGSGGVVPPRQALALGWLAAAVAGAVVASPVLALGYTQRGTNAWLGLPGNGALRQFTGLFGPTTMLIAVVVVIAGGIVVSAAFGPRRLRLSWPGSLPALCLPWLILPPLILLAGSYLVTPMYTQRYILFCVPAIALLAGAGLAALGWVAGAVALVVIGVLGIPSQQHDRGADGHGDNVRQADRIVAEYMRPGDAVLEYKAENFAQAYPYGIRKLNPVAQAKSPIKSATLVGTFLPQSVVRQRLTHVARVWVIEYGRTTPLVVLDGLHFRLVRTWRASDIWLYLYTQSGDY